MAKVKLVDVAEYAGVSKSTVSQYLNGRYDYMSEKTRIRIEQAIKTLNYVPNSIARSLKTDTTLTIGVVVRDITGYYTSRAIRGIDDYCKEQGYNVVIYNTDFDPETEAKALHSLNHLNVDGILIAPSGKNSALIDDYENKGLPVVQFQIAHRAEETNIILSDYRQAAFEATEYLIELGHKNICFVTQDFSDVYSRKERYEGFTAALNKHQIALSEVTILHWSREQGFAQQPCKLLQSTVKPTAFFSQHLAITAELLTVFNEHNVQIPDDVSLLGFDDLPMAEFFKVPITVIQQQAYDVGGAAANLLLKRIKRPQLAAQKSYIPCRLLKRDSCKKIN
ncbi:LacI family DNA-binding transcriptional regulator [Gayadomonas joobiniege]|uniref:LacI family DNA-binding transcriptional regulator n=1 Tax=Gayadomonas joobiniege TaxID=1234606 RepID=UPI00036178D1|nr:LacI family DNA-binding transcriptional regulator [Gayadomonas joobiniege]